MTENEQKLLDYFNDYNFIVANDERDTYRPRSEKDWQGMSRPYRQYICSKHFEFVKRLVKEDKIDLDMVREKLGIPCCVWYGSGRIIAVNDVEDYKQVLMLLAIQEDPITFLATILK